MSLCENMQLIYRELLFKEAVLQGTNVIGGWQEVITFVVLYVFFFVVVVVNLGIQML